MGERERQRNLEGQRYFSVWEVSMWGRRKNSKVKKIDRVCSLQNNGKERKMEKK